MLLNVELYIEKKNPDSLTQYKTEPKLNFTSELYKIPFFGIKKGRNHSRARFWYFITFHIHCIFNNFLLFSLCWWMLVEVLQVVYVYQEGGFGWIHTRWIDLMKIKKFQANIKMESARQTKKKRKTLQMEIATINYG